MLHRSSRAEAEQLDRRPGCENGTDSNGRFADIGIEDLAFRP